MVYGLADLGWKDKTESYQNSTSFRYKNDYDSILKVAIVILNVI